MTVPDPLAEDLATLRQAIDDWVPDDVITSKTAAELDAALARVEAVIEAARRSNATHANHCSPFSRHGCTCGLQNLRAALAALDGAA